MEIVYDKKTIDRFWSKVLIPDDPNACWLWQGSINKISSYGQFYFGDDREQAHRFSWEVTNGPILLGLLICHKCEINYPVGDISYRACVNPNHLYPGTDYQNHQDSVRAKRHSYGVRVPRHKLTVDDVIKMRTLRASGETYRALGVIFDVNEKTAWDACNNVSWASVPV